MKVCSRKLKGINVKYLLISGFLVHTIQILEEVWETETECIEYVNRYLAERERVWTEFQHEEEFYIQPQKPSISSVFLFL